MSSYNDFKSKLDWAMSFQRTGTFPLDRTSMFASYDDAVKYAKGDTSDPDSRKLCGTSYVGQIITVFENDVVTVYKITADRSLVEVGRATSGDNKTITLNSDNTLSLFGFDKATAGQQLKIVNKGTEEDPNLQLEWFTPDTSTVSGLQETVGQLKTTVGDEKSGLVKDVADLKSNKADKTSVYTKDEIDGKLTGALHYKGSKDTFQILLDEVTAGTITPTIGDVYNIVNAGGTDASGIAIKAGDNVIYNGTGWDVSSGTVDLSAYYTSEKIDEKLAKKVDVVEGSRLMTNAEGTKLEGLSKVEASETNGNIKIDDTETKVYTLPTASADAIGGIKTSTENNGISVDATGVAKVNKIDSNKIDGIVAEAAKTTHKFTIGEASFDGSADVTVTADQIPLPTNVVKKTDIATETAVGVVKGSAAKNQIAVGEDGTMTVNKIDASKIDGVVAEATKTTHKLTAGDATFDGSADVSITTDTIGAAKKTDLDSYVKKTDIASAETAGIVKGSAAKNQIAVGEDGTMTVNKIDASKIDGTASKADDANKLGGVAATEILVADGDTNLTAKVKNAAAADTLKTARDISLAGDATGSASFDGSANIEISTTLKDVGKAGTYTKVTTDAKGRVTSGESLTAADIPDITLAKISDAGSLAGKSEVALADLAKDATDEINALKTASHAHSNKAVIDGITASKVSNWDDAASKIDKKADKATTIAGYGITDAYTKTEVDGKVAGAFHFKGTYATFAALTAAVTDGTITPSAGDVYNITTGGGTDINGTLIKSGDNVAYVTTPTAGWDVLGGTMDLSAYATTEFVNTELAKKAEKTVVDGINDRLGTVETTVGNETAGLVKDVADNKSAISTLNTDVSNLKTTVGNETAGLVKDVADNKSAISTLNGDEKTTGSVKQIVAASASELNTAITNITKDGGTIDTKVNAAVTAHNTDETAHSDLFAAKQNKAINASITYAVADFVEDGTIAPYKAEKTVTGLTAAKNYSPSISPSPTSNNVIAAALFYPFAEVNGGKLVLYCKNIPSEAITVNGTFTEIQ